MFFCWSLGTQVSTVPHYVLLLHCSRFAPICAGSKNGFCCSSLANKPKSWTMATVFPSGVDCQLFLWWNDPCRMCWWVCLWHDMRWWSLNICHMLRLLVLSLCLCVPCQFAEQRTFTFAKPFDIVGDQAVQRLNVPTAHLRPPWFTSKS